MSCLEYMWTSLNILILLRKVFEFSSPQVKISWNSQKCLEQLSETCYRTHSPSIRSQFFSFFWGVGWGGRVINVPYFPSLNRLQIRICSKLPIKSEIMTFFLLCHKVGMCFGYFILWWSKYFHTHVVCWVSVNQKDFSSIVNPF